MNHSDDELMFFMNCWCELYSLLAAADVDNSQEFSGAADVLKLMMSIERKFQK